MAASSTALRAPVPAVAGGLSVIYVVWGSTYLGMKVAGETIPPLLMASARCLIAGALLFALFGRRGDVEGDRLTWGTWRDSAIVSAGLMGGLALVALGERWVPSGIAALLIAAAPLWMTLFDGVLHGVRLTRLIVAGLAIGFAGVALLVSPGGAGGEIETKGLVLLLVSPILWSAGTVYSKRARLPARPFVATSVEFLCGGVIVGVAGLAIGQGGELDLHAISTRSLVAFLYLVVVGSIFAFSAYVWLLQVAPISLISTYAYVNPVVALTLGALIDNERITASSILAGGVILLGVALIVSGHARRPAEEEGVH